MSSWLNVLPIAEHHFDLSDREFRDALSIHYRKPLLSLPTNCDGCRAPFDLSHALSCRRGCLVIHHHNEVRDAFRDLADLAWGQVVKEPIVREATTSTSALIANLAERGAWTPQTEALFDIRVIDTDAQSYRHQIPLQVLTTAEREKKNKYSATCEEEESYLLLSGSRSMVCFAGKPPDSYNVSLNVCPSCGREATVPPLTG